MLALQLVVFVVVNTLNIPGDVLATDPGLPQRNIVEVIDGGTSGKERSDEVRPPKAPRKCLQKDSSEPAAMLVSVNIEHPRSPSSADLKNMTREICLIGAR
jgi:hypothetical protein